MDNDRIQIILEAVNKASAEFHKTVQGINGISQATNQSTSATNRSNQALAATSQVYARVRLAVLAAASAVALYTRHILNEVDALSKQARALETTTEKLSGLAYAADLAGVGSREMSMALNELARAMEEASGDPASKAARAFRTVGIATEGLRDRDVVETFYQLTDGFSRLSGAATKADLAQALLGGRGRQLIDFLNSGSMAIKEQAAELGKLGAAIRTETGKEVEEFNDNLTRMQYGLRGVAVSVLSETLPSLNQMVSGIIEVAKNQEVVSILSRDLTSALTVLARVSIYLYGGLKLISTLVGGVLYTAWLNQVTAIKALIQLFAGLGQGLLNVGGAVIETVKRFAGFGDVISAVLRGDFAGAAQAAKSTLSSIGDEAARIGGALAETWKASAGVVLTAGGQIVENITSTASEAMDQIAKTAAAASAALEALDRGGGVQTVQVNGQTGKASQTDLTPAGGRSITGILLHGYGCCFC